MKARVKSKWLKALRSGEYSQTKGQLRSDTGFCCLGVLTDVYLKENKRRWSKDKLGNFGIRDGNGLFEISVLPQDVMKWAGLDKMNPLVKIPHRRQTASLSSCNDVHEMDFSEIASLIEKSL